MKAIVLILSISLLGMSVFPCTDSHPENATKLSIQKTLPSQDHGINDLCSPLCVCHCCHSHVVTTHVFITELVGLQEVSSETIYTEIITQGFSGSVLQPPQV